jgi:hypothetical protein
MKVQRNRNGHISWTDELINFIIENRYNISYASRETGIRNQTISRKLNQLGYTDRTKGNLRKYTVNENIFDNIDSKEKAYYLGLLAADGSLNQNSSLVRLSLHNNDKYMLEQFNDFVGSNRPIFSNKNDCCSEACINSFYMQKSLIKFGVGYQKSYNLKAPNINNLYAKSFILGLFDGDGSISKTIDKDGYPHYSFRITGTKDILEYCASHLYIFDGKYSIKLEHRCKDTYQLSVIGNKKTALLLLDLYDNNFNKPLKRKYFRFQELINYNGSFKEESLSKNLPNL